MQNDSEVVKRGNSDPLDPKERSRTFVFTYYPEFDSEVFYDSEVMRYCKYGIEKCPTTGRTHYQGYCVFNSQRTTRSVCKKYNCYMRPMRGNISQNDTYVSKDGNIKEFGNKPKQGERNDLTSTVNALVNRETTLENIILNEPMLYHQYGRTLEKALSVSYTHRVLKPVVHWYFGASGSGKTRTAVELSNSYYIKDTNTKWWDGYEQQEVIILDDIRKDDIPFNQLLRLLDRYHYLGEIKGGHIPINSTYIVLTSDEPPWKWWQGNDLNQIRRRCDIIKKFE